jgi:hypothetical protein
MNTIKQKSDISSKTAFYVLSVMTLVALWMRSSGLGHRPFAEDEYYFITSVHNLLEYGLPRFPDGGYYVRGIILQYITALSILLFGENQFAYRLPSMLFSIGTLPMAYLLGRQFLKRSWCIVLVAILVLSCWVIEFSRFARMYSALQFFSVCFFWSLYRYAFDDESINRYIAVAFALAAILTHQLGIFIALLLFLPLPALYDKNFSEIFRKQYIYIAISILTLAIGYLQIKINFRLIGVSDSLPQDYIYSTSKSLHWSSFGTSVFGEFWFFSIGAFIAAIIAIFYIIFAVRNRSNLDAQEQLLGGLLAIAVCSAVFHQFAISALIVIIILLRDFRLLVKRPHVYLLVSLTAVVIFWFILLFFNQAWIDSVGSGNIIKSYLRSIRLAFFMFPDLYRPIILAFADNIPILGFLLGLSIVGQLFFIRKLSFVSIVMNPVIPIVIILLIIGFKQPLYVRTRYVYFLYPMALCVALLSANQIKENIRYRFRLNQGISTAVAIVLCFVLFFLSEDFNTYYLKNTSSDTVSYRTGRFEKYMSHWYPRIDFQLPAEFINSTASDSSRIILAFNVNTAAAYLKRDFAIYWPIDYNTFPSISRKGGTRDLWSGCRLLGTIEDVADYTRRTNTVWLMTLGRGDPAKFNPDILWPARVLSVEEFIPGRDERIIVWEIKLKVS